MPQLQPSIDLTGDQDQVALNTQDIQTIMDEMNRGVDPTGIGRRAILASQIRVLQYSVNPTKLHAGTTLASGGTGSLVINFQNTGLTNLSGQTFLPIFYVDVFVDPSDTSSTANIYAGGDIYPDGVNMTSEKQNFDFTWYLRNSTPGTSSDVVSYVLAVKNNGASAHAYWASIKLLLPADGNLNEGGVAAFLS